jgi:hypothetical protein
MEPTITQNSALYLAHRKVSKRRATLFRWLRTAGSTQGPDAQRQLTSTVLFIANFNRAFRRIVGRSPAQFRKSLPKLRRSV